MSKPLLVITEELYRYSLGPGHPMGPDRVRAAIDLAEYFDLTDSFDRLCPEPLNTAGLQLAHTPPYIAATRTEVPTKRYGLGTEDNPISHGLSTVAARVAGGTLSAVRAVWEGNVNRAVNLSGGLHHAMADKMNGFCMYNDAAIAIQWLLDQGAQRIAYLDFDAHHGDGVEQFFYDDPRVLTVSIHESGLYLFPHTGFAHEIGGPQALGTAVNVPLPRHADDDQWLYSIHAIVAPLIAAFRPQFLITQHGADPHADDPLADLSISVDAMAHVARSAATWAETWCENRWVALGGGGYRVESVARTWAHVLAAVAGTALPADAPMPAGFPVPTLGDPSAAFDATAYNPHQLRFHSPDPAVIQTSKQIFPYWGLPAY